MPRLYPNNIQSDVNTKAAKGDAVKTISRSGTTFTATKADDSTFTFTQQDNNTTYSAGTGINLSGTTFSNKYAKTQLYYNASGNTGTVTLSQSAANFNHIRIYYAETDDGTPLPQSSITIYSPNGSRTYLSYAMRFSSGNLWVFTKGFSISGTSVAVVSGWNGAGYFSASTATWTTGNNYITIIRVEGWNE